LKCATCAVDGDCLNANCLPVQKICAADCTDVVKGINTGCQDGLRDLSLLLGVGGLVFMGDLYGYARAFDARTGTLLWEDRVGDATGGGIVTYQVANRPFVAIVTGQPSGIWPVENPQSIKVAVYSPAGR